ncbi:MAG: hypothetical protein Q8P67_12290 [archaeon]|nr:hypothetical protein [archaeon]
MRAPRPDVQRAVALRAPPVDGEDVPRAWPSGNVSNVKAGPHPDAGAVARPHRSVD